VRRDRHLIARGASDDKGQFLAHLVALQAWVRVGGPPCDVVTIVDGAEEIGSPDLAGVLARHRRSSILDGPVGAILISDTRVARPGVPSLTVSQRGLLSLTVTVDVGGVPVHAGRFSGAVVDPTRVLAGALLAAAREVERLPKAPQVVPGRSRDDAVRRAAGPRALMAEPADRSTRCGALTITALRAGGTPGSIPVRAEARLDVRLPPGFSPKVARRRVVGALRQARPPGVAMRIVCDQSVRGSSLVQPPGTAFAVRAACRVGFGVDPQAVASGGSIPAVDLLLRAFGVAPILLGLGPPNDGAHGPDEHLDLDDWARGVDTSVVFLEAYARSSPATTREIEVLRTRTTLRRHGHQTDDRSASLAPTLGRGGLRPQSKPGGCR
jgi:succinyl-diaminopimelate desuccinylase